MELEQFAHDLVQDVIASAEADGISTHDAFAERVLADLETSGHLEDWYVAYYRAHGVEASGYGLNEALGTLDVFVVQFRQQPVATKAGSKEVAALAKRGTTYIEKSASGLADLIDDAIDAHDMAA